MAKKDSTLAATRTITKGKEIATIPTNFKMGLARPVFFRTLGLKEPQKIGAFIFKRLTKIRKELAILEGFLIPRLSEELFKVLGFKDLTDRQESNYY